MSVDLLLENGDSSKAGILFFCLVTIESVKSAFLCVLIFIFNTGSHFCSRYFIDWLADCLLDWIDWLMSTLTVIVLLHFLLIDWLIDWLTSQYLIGHIYITFVLIDWLID